MEIDLAGNHGELEGSPEWGTGAAAKRLEITADEVIFYAHPNVPEQFQDGQSFSTDPSETRMSTSEDTIDFEGQE